MVKLYLFHSVIKSVATKKRMLNTLNKETNYEEDIFDHDNGSCDDMRGICTE